MLALAFDLPAGRYHATSWGRHVNEADVAWPPDPWRIARALLATWHRKVASPEVSRQTLARLLQALASELPAYALPPAVHAHTRHYMPSREGRTESPTLVFDAFARLGADLRIVALWPGLRFGAEEERALDLLLARLGYLGRAESWVEAARLTAWTGDVNCVPAGDSFDAAAEASTDLVPLLAPLSPEDYAELRGRVLARAEEKRASRKEVAQLHATLPEDWLAGLELDTADLRAAGWSAPPAARWVHYARPAAALASAALPRIQRRRPGRRATLVRYAVHGRPLCRLGDAVHFGECLRRAIMGCAKRVLGEDRIPAALSGHGTADHTHAFFLPEAHGIPEGRIHHALVFAAGGFDRDAIEVLGRLRHVAEPGGPAWQVVFEGAGTSDSFTSPLLEVASEWTSATPYLHPWHRKPRFEAPEQIRRECLERGLPELVAAVPVAEIFSAGRALRPIHFRRFRSKRGLVQPDRHGGFWRLRFAAPVAGPLALGFGCHFGLGLFTPAE